MFAFCLSLNRINNNSVYAFLTQLNFHKLCFFLFLEKPSEKLTTPRSEAHPRYTAEANLSFAAGSQLPYNEESSSGQVHSTYIY